MFGLKNKCDNEEGSTNEGSKETKDGKYGGRHRMEMTDSNDSADKESPCEPRCRCKSKGKTVTIECEMNRTSSGTGSRCTDTNESTEQEREDSCDCCQCKRRTDKQKTASLSSTTSNTSTNISRSGESCVSPRSTRSDDSKCSGSSKQSVKYLCSEKIYISAQNLYINDPVNISGNLAGANDPKTFNYGDPQPSYGFQGNNGGGQGTIFTQAVNIGNQHVHNYSPQESRKSAYNLPVTNGDEQGPYGCQVNNTGLEVPVSDRRESPFCPSVTDEGSFRRSLMIEEDQQISPFCPLVNNAQESPACCLPKNDGGQRGIYPPEGQQDPCCCASVNINSQQGTFSSPSATVGHQQTPWCCLPISNDQQGISICSPVNDGGQQQSCCCPPPSNGGQEQACCCPPANDEGQQGSLPVNNVCQQNPCCCPPINTGGQQESCGCTSLNNGGQQSSSCCQPVNNGGPRPPYSCPPINNAGQQQPCCCPLVSNGAQEKPFCCPPVNSSGQQGSSSCVPGSNGGQPQLCCCNGEQQGSYGCPLVNNAENCSDQQATLPSAPNRFTQELQCLSTDSNSGQNGYPGTSTGISGSQTAYPCSPSDTGGTGGGQKEYSNFHTDTDDNVKGSACTGMVTGSGQPGYSIPSTDTTGGKEMYSRLSPTVTSVGQQERPYFPTGIQQQYPYPNTHTSVSQQGYPFSPIDTGNAQQGNPHTPLTNDDGQEGCPCLPKDNLSQKGYPSFTKDNSGGQEVSSDCVLGSRSAYYSAANNREGKDPICCRPNNDSAPLSFQLNYEESKQNAPLYQNGRADTQRNCNNDPFINSGNAIQCDNFRSSTSDSQSSSLKDPSVSRSMNVSNFDQDCSVATVGSHPYNKRICDTSMGLLQTAPTAMGLLCGMELQERSHQHRQAARSVKNKTCWSQD